MWKTHLVDSTLVVDNFGNEIAQALGDYESDALKIEANATLIAAAPDLLAACEWCAKWTDTYADANVLPVVKALKAAIAKAGGEA